jgi:hypothetical protein
MVPTWLGHGFAPRVRAGEIEIAMYKTELGSSNTALSDVVYIGHAGFRMGGERATPTEMRDEVTAPLGASLGSRPASRIGSSLERTRVMEPSTQQQQIEEWRVPRSWDWFPSQPFWVGLIAGALAVMLLASIGRWRFSQGGDGGGSAGGEQRAPEITTSALDRIVTSAATFERAPAATAPGETKANDGLADAGDALSEEDPPAFLARRLALAGSSAPPVEEKPATATAATAVVTRRSQRSAGATAKARSGVRRTAADGAVAGAAAPPEAAALPPPLARPAASGWVDPWAD